MPHDADSRKVMLRFSGSVYGELEDLAVQRKATVSQIVLLALSLIRLVIRELSRGNRLMLVGPDGRTHQEIVLPSVNAMHGRQAQA